MSSTQRRVLLVGGLLLAAVLPHVERLHAQAPVEIPAILTQPGDSIPECFNDPSIWREWIEHRRGSKLPAGFGDVARYFQEEGERLGMHWPSILVQSVHETNFYRYGGRALAENFNMGGVGITLDEGTTTRQNFLTARRGVRAMLEHVAVYADPHAMGPRIQEQNYREHGVKRFTADRTNEAFTTIAEKYDVFRGNAVENGTPDRRVKFNDLGSWESEEELKKRKGYARYSPVRRKIGGATLTYAGDPFYGAKVYLKWVEATQWVTDRCEEKKRSGESLATPEASPAEPPADAKAWVVSVESSGTFADPPANVTTTTVEEREYQGSESQLVHTFRRKYEGKEIFMKKWSWALNGPPARIHEGQELDPLTVNGKFVFSGKWSGAKSASHYKLGVHPRPLGWVKEPEQTTSIGYYRPEHPAEYPMTVPEGHWPRDIVLELKAAHGSNAWVKWTYKAEQ